MWPNFPQVSRPSPSPSWAEAVEDLQGPCSKARLDGLAVEPNLGLEGATSLLEVELVAQARAFEGLIVGVGIAEAVRPVGQVRHPDRLADRIPWCVLDDLKEDSVGGHLPQCCFRPAGAGPVAQGNRIGGGSKHLHRVEHGGDRPAHRVPAGRKSEVARRLRARGRIAAVAGAGAHRQSDRQRG
jgi:hypothetical protein